MHRASTLRRASKLIALVSVTAAALIAVVASSSAGKGSQHPVAATSVSAKAATPPFSQIAPDIRIARAATAKYAMSLSRAKAGGYRILTKMIPNMGYHFMNPKVTSFDLRKPEILVYEHSATGWQLGALEWVFTSKPAKPPLPGAQYGVFPAACQYVDGTFVPETAQSKCAAKASTGAKFSFWHPKLITLHLWLWYPNPSGLYMGTNPLAAQFNQG
jgi:hypothetical protein